MVPETPTGEAFGFPGVTDPGLVPGEPDPLAETPAGPAASEPQAPAAPPAEVPAATPETPAPTPEGTQPVAGETPPVPPMYAGRFTSVEDLEAGYNEVRDLQTRTARRANEVEARQQEMERALAYLVQQQQQSGAQGPTPALSDEQAELQRVLQPLVDQQLAPMRQQIAFTGEQQQQAMVAAQQQAAVSQFRTAHPEVTPGSPEDWQVAEAVREFGLPLTTEALTNAYEAVKNPQLQQVARAYPAFLHSEDGMVLARRMASLPDPAAVQQATAAAASDRAAQAEQARKAAHVESGGGSPPAPAPPGGIRDELDEMDAEYAAAKGKGGAFFGVK